MKTVVEMTREAGGFDATPKFLERFEALVRADEQEKYKWDIHSCGPTCKRYACVAMREAIESEREACARIVETPISGEQDDITMQAKDRVAAAIRARGNT
jgi:hypothetical protein